MIKRTLYFENPVYLTLSNGQLKVKYPEIEKSLSQVLRERFSNSIPIEDVGVVVLDNGQITITQGALNALVKNNCSIIVCDNQHMPSGLLLSFEGNTLHGERFRQQVKATLPTSKQLWQQTVKAKIENQRALLQRIMNEELPNMAQWAREVRSGDSSNLEARAAVFYWSNLFPKEIGFARNREGGAPNNLLNYGYAILRAVIARAIVAGGLSPALGIYHKNRYNPFPLADDIMEPYRPYVDSIVLQIISDGLDYTQLLKEIKIELLSLPTVDVKIDGVTKPLMLAAGVTVNSLVKCFKKEQKQMIYPQLE